MTDDILTAASRQLRERVAELETWLKRDGYASAALTVRDLKARLAEVERLIPQEVKLKIAADGDALGETIVKLVSNFEAMQGYAAEVERERDGFSWCRKAVNDE